MTAGQMSGEPVPGSRAPGLFVGFVLLGTELLLVAFSIGSAVLDQPALAIMAGTASISLASEIARRFLLSPIGPLPGPSEPAAESPPPPERGA